ncbi:hypothetical protein L1887_63372 [Cichorium endivia]|nr:hypothetical protein L1887_63372 [Cichorium endivia]
MPLPFETGLAWSGLDLIICSCPCPRVPMELTQARRCHRSGACLGCDAIRRSSLRLSIRLARSFRSITGERNGAWKAASRHDDRDAVDAMDPTIDANGCSRCSPCSRGRRLPVRSVVFCSFSFEPPLSPLSLPSLPLALPARHRTEAAALMMHLCRLGSYVSGAPLLRLAGWLCALLCVLSALNPNRLRIIIVFFLSLDAAAFSCLSCGGAAWPARFSFCRPGSASLNRSLGITQRRPGCCCSLPLSCQSETLDCALSKWSRWGVTFVTRFRGIKLYFASTPRRRIRMATEQESNTDDALSVDDRPRRAVGPGRRLGWSKALCSGGELAEGRLHCNGWRLRLDLDRLNALLPWIQVQLALALGLVPAFDHRLLSSSSGPTRRRLSSAHHHPSSPRHPCHPTLVSSTSPHPSPAIRICIRNPTSSPRASAQSSW